MGAKMKRPINDYLSWLIAFLLWSITLSVTSATVSSTMGKRPNSYFLFLTVFSLSLWWIQIPSTRCLSARTTLCSHHPSICDLLQVGLRWPTPLSQHWRWKCSHLLPYRVMCVYNIIILMISPGCDEGTWLQHHQLCPRFVGNCHQDRQVSTLES